MYTPPTPDWEKMIRSGAQRKYVVDIFETPGDISPYITGLPINNFSVSIDRRSDIRRTASLEVSDSDLLFELVSPGSGLNPYGIEIRIRSGFTHAGTDYLVPLGWFRIEEVNWDEENYTFTLDLNDRAKMLEKSKDGVPINAAGMYTSQVINDLILDSLPYVQIEIDPSLSNYRLPGGTTYDQGKLAALHDIAEVMGGEFFFTADGVAKFAPMPFLNPVDPMDPDWIVDTTYTNTEDGGVMVGVNRNITRRDMFNQIHIYGVPATENTPQPYAAAIDDDPLSPTYYYGSFGQADKKIERQELVTSTQCAEYARNYLQNSIGLAKTISTETLANPAIDAGDIIRVIYADGTAEIHIADTVDMSESGFMNLDTRSRQED